MALTKEQISNMILEGTIKAIIETQTFASGFQKRELVLLTDEQYPQPISIDFLQNNCDLVDYHEVGSKVKIHINIRGREWTSPQGEVKYFNSIIGWRIKKAEQEPTQAKPIEKGEQTRAGEKEVFAEDEEDSPF